MMEQLILDLLGSDKNKSYSIFEINDALNLKTADELKELLSLLKRMEKEAKIYHTKKDNYMLFGDSHLKTGTYLATKKSFGFVDIIGDEDVFIAPNNVNGAIQGDKVVVEIISKAGLKLEGRILRIIERDVKNMVGEVYFENNVCRIKLDDEKVKLDLVIPEGRTLGAVEGHKVLLRMGKQIHGNQYEGDIIKIIGHKNDPGVDILSIVNKLGIHDTFPEEVMNELDSIPDKVTPEEMKNRRDLRDQMIFTIDGDDTKDIDDAIEVRKLDNGNYILGVHIADVSYYVREGMAIDEEAYERGTSVYLADRVIPMLPHKLSNGICSLNPGVDRLAISCEMEINEQGNVVNYDIFESVIRSKIQMTYKKVNMLLEDNQVAEGYEPYVESLLMMKKLAGILRKNKVGRGYIDFEIEEPKVIVDEDGMCVDVALRERGTGEKLIEDFMIAANETVASAIYFMELPFIYRIHGKPNEEKINNFMRFVSILGYKLSGKIKGDKITPKMMQKILDELKDKKEYNMISTLLLRSMQKAVYDKNNIGHFGLASDCYTHFTSPIRRYPDTTVHRLLRTYLFNHDMSVDTVSYWENKLVVLGEHTSACERNAVECERQVDDMKMAEFMSQHIGEEYDGMISGVTQFGLFVELPNLVEGLIRLEDIPGDYYIFEEETFSVVGQKTKKRYRLGDNVRVEVKAANKETRTIDFVLAKKLEKELDEVKEKRSRR